MSRSIWKGHISFGLVEIPVSLVKAEEPHELDLHLVDRRDRAPIGYERVNKTTGEMVAWEDIVKAHEQDGELVLLSDDELSNANVEVVNRIDILEFVDGATIHPAYFERPYYLEPASKKGGAKAYVLLRDTLERTGKVGVANIVIRTRQHLAALTTRDAALVLILLRFGDELREVDGLDLPEDGAVKPAELAMAEQLVASMDSTWDPSRYHDAYFDDVMAMIAKKREAGQTEPLEVEAPPPREGTSVVDLMPLLRQSMARRKEAAADDGEAADDGAAESATTARSAKPAAKRKKKAAARKRPAARASTATRAKKTASRRASAPPARARKTA